MSENRDSAVESLNARFRRAVRHRGHFPNEQVAMRVLYLVATTKRKNRENLTGKPNNDTRKLCVSIRMFNTHRLVCLLAARAGVSLCRLCLVLRHLS